MRGWFVRWGAGALAAGLALGLGSLQPVTAVAGEVADDDGPGRMLLVLDSSGSMAEPAGDGRSRMAAAKQALRTTVDALPDEQVAGLRVYGSKVFSAKDPGACTDSELVVEPGTDNRDAMLAAVGRMKPYGETPIGHVLREAGKDLGDEGARSIILVSDGVPTCDPDPCVVARELSRSGVNLRIDVVGLDVDARAREALDCIATNGGGTYYDARDTEQLTKALTRLAERSARPFQQIGQPVTGTPDPAEAPTLTEGDWADHYDLGSDVYYYRLARSTPGSSLVASASVRGAGTSGTMLRSQVLTDGGEVCDAGVGMGNLGQLLSTVSAASQFDPEEECTGADEVVLEVEVYSRGEEPEVPVEIRVVEVPPVADLDALPRDPHDEIVWVDPGRGDAAPVRGGTSFADAEEVGPGSYGGEIVPGEILTFAVDADWGQQVDVRVEADVDRRTLQAGIRDTQLGVQVFGPARAERSTVFMRGTDLADREPVLGARTSVATASGGVYLDNLDLGADTSFLAGRHTVAVSLAPDANRDLSQVPRLPVTFRLDVGVSGEAGPGPEFVGGEEEPAPDAAEEEADEDPGSASSAPAEDDSLPLVPVLALGLGGVAAAGLLVGLAVVVLRRRSRTR